MADNVTFQTTVATPASGTVVASDDVAVGGTQPTAQVQYVKLVDGALNGTAPIGGDATNGLDVDVTRLPALVAGSANIGDVDVLTVPAPLSTTGGGTEATAHRVTIASDSTGVLSVDDNGGSLTVDGSVSVSGAVDTELTTADLDTGAGTDTRAVVGIVLAASGGGLLAGAANPVPVSDNAGSLTVDGSVSLAAAIPAGTNNIGDVDVLSVPSPLSSAGGGTEAAALRVTIANDSTGLVSIDDNGGSVTVDGSVSITGAIPAGTNNIGDVDIASGPTGASALQVQGPAAADAPVVGNPLLSGGRASDVAPTAVTTDGDAVSRWLDRRGATKAAIVDDAGDSAMDGANNALRVNVVAGGGTGGTAIADESAFTEGTTNFTPVGGVLNDTITSDPTEDQAAAARITPKRAIHVNLRDNTGAEVSVGGGTQYDEDTASVAAEKVTMAGVVRKDTAATMVDLDGDRTELEVDGSGRLWVNASGVPVPVTDNAGSLTVDGAVSLAAAIPAGTNNIGDVDVLTVPAPLSTTGGGTEAAALRVTLANDSTGLVSVDDNGGALTVDNGGTFAVQDSEKVVDNAAFTDGTTKVQPGGYIFDETAGTALTENDAAAARIDSKRAQVAVIEDETTRGRRTTVTAANALKVDGSAVTQPVSGTVTATLAAGTNTNEVVGDAAHDAAAAGNPVLVAGISVDTDDTAPPNRVSAESDVVRIATDRDGAVFARPHGPQLWSYHEDSSSALTDASVHAAPGAGLSLYVTDIVVSTGAATALNVFFEEATTRVLGPWYLEAVNGRGLAIHFVTPKKITVNTALTVTTSAAIAHSIDVTGYVAQG